MPWTHIPCSDCDGTGSVTCPICDGARGRWVTIGGERHWDPCTNCYGKGSVRCPNLDDKGDGKVMVWQD